MIRKLAFEKAFDALELPYNDFNVTSLIRTKDKTIQRLVDICFTDKLVCIGD